MYIARIIYPVKVLGPGNRIGIWFAGCHHYCKGCSNPELWEKNKAYKTTLTQIRKMINSIASAHCVDGFTITGGDPLNQPGALKNLLIYLKSISDDILLYTGYSYEYVMERHRHILDEIAVLIDGRYIEELNNNAFLRGSSNQNIIICKEKFRNMYTNYIRNGENEIQNFNTPTGVISVGIHKPGFKEELDSILKMKGLESDE